MFFLSLCVQHVRSTKYSDYPDSMNLLRSSFVVWQNHAVLDPSALIINELLVVGGALLHLFINLFVRPTENRIIRTVHHVCMYALVVQEVDDPDRPHYTVYVYTYVY